MSLHFTLDELTRSATADAAGLANTPDVDALANLSRLATTLLEPVRTLLGQRLQVTSGYRSPAVNAAIAEVGAKHSAHEDGRAADVVPLDGMGLPDAFDVIRKSDLGFDQCILESGCVHLAIARPGEVPRRQALIRHGTDGNWTYSEVT